MYEKKRKANLPVRTDRILRADPVRDVTVRTVLARQTALPVVLLLLGCTRSADSGRHQTVDASSAPRIARAAPCTLATPLVPGIPGSPGHLMQSAINPNGQSELAAHMRSMQAQLQAARPLIARSEKVPPLFDSFTKIRCAWPTNPADRNESFDASAQAYLAAVAALDAAAPTAAAPAYDQVLGACRSCHERTCSGAIVAIEALRLEPTQSQ